MARRRVSEWAYVLCFLFVWFDAVIPIFPGETTLNAASTLAAQGISSPSSSWSLEPSVRLSVTRRCSGSPARAGQSASPSTGARKSEGSRSLGRPRPIARTIDRRRALRPGCASPSTHRWEVIGIPYRRFLPWSILGGVLWSVYTCSLGVQGGDDVLGFPTRVAGHLLAHHVGCVDRDLLRRPPEEEWQRRVLSEAT